MTVEKLENPQAAPAPLTTMDPSSPGTPTPAPACPTPPPTPGQAPPDASTGPKKYVCPRGWVEHPTDPRYWFNPVTHRKFPKHFSASGFQKGQSGNPSGRTKKKHCIPDLLRWAGEHRCPPELIAKMTQVFGLKRAQPLTVHQAIALRVCMEALNGDIKAAQFIAERTEGKVLDRMLLDTTAAGPLVQVISQAQADAQAKTPETPEAPKGPQ